MEFKLKPILIDFNADCASIVKQFLEYRENLDLLLSLHLELSDEEFLNIITKLYNCTIPDYDELIGQMLGVTNVIHKIMEFHFPNLGSEIFTVYGRELKDKKFTVKNYHTLVKSFSLVLIIQMVIIFLLQIGVLLILAKKY